MSVIHRVVGGTSLGYMEADVACKTFVTGLNKHFQIVTNIHFNCD